MLAEFRRASNDLKRTIEDEVEAESLRETLRISPAPAALPPASAAARRHRVARHEAWPRPA